MSAPSSLRHVLLLRRRLVDPCGRPVGVERLPLAVSDVELDPVLRLDARAHRAVAQVRRQVQDVREGLDLCGWWGVTSIGERA